MGADGRGCFWWILVLISISATMIKFGTSGWRAIMGEEFTFQNVRTVVQAIASFDLPRIKEALSPRDCTVCGRIPVYAMMTAAKMLDADAVKVLHHTTSGDVTGNRAPGQYTVGYMAAAVYKG